MSRALSIMVAALVLVGAEARAQYGAVAVGVTVGNFEASLQPYGVWLQHPSYGRIWQPSVGVVGSDFYPYGTGGQWVWTQAGWSFESSYPFGWATFHYGRWAYEPGYGWVWIPGLQWAPSWVSWRGGGSYVGWAPLGPSGAPAYTSSQWCYVDRDSFTRPDAYRRHLGGGRFHEAVAVTQPWELRGPSRDYARGSGTPPPPRGYQEPRPTFAPSAGRWAAVPSRQPHERFEGFAGGRRGAMPVEVDRGSFGRFEGGRRGGAPVVSEQGGFGRFEGGRRSFGRVEGERGGRHR